MEQQPNQRQSQTGEQNAQRDPQRATGTEQAGQGAEHGMTGDQNRQDAREGGYGDDTGMNESGQSTPQPQKGAGMGEHGDSGAGRENPGRSSIDSDDALGNRAGGYGRAPDGKE